MKKKIIIQTIFGLIPFFLKEIFSFVGIKDFQNSDLEKISIIYGALIVSFLTGMQWQRFITKNEESILKLNIPIIIFLWVWSFSFNSFLNPAIIIISGLALTLLTDLVFQKKLMNSWFIKLRIIVTLVAIISFV